MKTQIITIEPHDDVISIRDKMGWCKASRILLVLPARGRVLKDRLDLTLLLRQSLRLGAQLALITHDAEIRYHAKSLGIPTFVSIHQAQERRWSRPRLPQVRNRPLTKRSQPPFHPLTHPKTSKQMPLTVRITFFLLGIFALLSIAAAILPSAEITLKPEERTQEVLVTVQASLTTERVRVTGVIPLREIPVIVEGQDSLITTGKSIVPRENARGKLLFTNLTDKTVIVPAGTVVSTLDGAIRFATDVTDYVPAGLGQATLIPATAMTPGSQGNLPANRLQAIEGPLGANLTVTNPQPTTGGSDIEAPMPTSFDRTQLTERLVRSLQQTAMEEIMSQLSPKDVLLTPSPVLVRTLEKVFDPEENQPARELTLTLRVEFKGQYVAGEDLKQLANLIMDSSLHNGYLPVSETLVGERVSEIKIGEDGIARWDMRFSRKVQAQINHSQVTSWILGQTPAQAAITLANRLPLDQPTQMSIKPTWWPFLPLLPTRIHIDIP